MALRIVGRVRTMRRLVTAVVGLCDPRGSTAPEIIEWTANHPCGTTRCQHPPPPGSEMQKERARLLAGLRYSVNKGILEEHAGRYKLAMESCGRPWPGPARQDARPRVTWARSRRAFALSARARSRQRTRHRHTSATRTRRRAAASRGGRRRQHARPTSRRRRASVRRLRSGRDRARSRARARERERARQRRRAKDKHAHKDKGKAEGGSGGCGGCGQARPERSGDDRRASHLMHT